MDTIRSRSRSRGTILAALEGFESEVCLGGYRSMDIFAIDIRPYQHRRETSVCTPPDTAEDLPINASRSEVSIIHSLELVSYEELFLAVKSGANLRQSKNTPRALFG